MFEDLGLDFPQFLLKEISATRVNFGQFLNNYSHERPRAQDLIHFVLFFARKEEPDLESTTNKEP